MFEIGSIRKKIIVARITPGNRHMIRSLQRLVREVYANSILIRDTCRKTSGDVAKCSLLSVIWKIN